MEQFWSIFFLIGLLVVMAHAWTHFNEPSFPQRETLPRTVDPLRYLFLRSTYVKARLAYVVGLIVLYVLFVAPGPTMIGALGDVGFKEFPPKAWALLIALVLTGVGSAPASVKWLNVLEEWLRRWVHSWFLVPYGLERTIGVLEDARYDPPPSQLSLVENSATRERLQENLKAPTGTLHPELFERLSKAWASLERFQRTRGVLRFMANVIGVLWHAQTRDPLITPGRVPIAHERIRASALYPLDPAFSAVVDSEVDGDGSLPSRMEANPSRRISRFAE